MRKLNFKWWHFGLLVAFLLTVLSPLASSSPDGLERVAENKGFAEKSKTAPFSVIADYLFPGIENEVLSTILAGLIGTALVFAICYGLAMLLKFRRRT